MTVIVCVDTQFGRTFLGKRQSRDARLIEDVLCSFGEETLVASTYSAPLFEGAAVRLKEELFSELEEDAVYFCEREQLAPFAAKIDTFVMYHWNRQYPSDVKLDFFPEKAGLKNVMVEEFVGTSHKLITKEVYQR